MFLKNPFIPLAKANIAIVAGDAHEDIIKTLDELNIKVIHTIKCKDVDESISFHPDIIMHPINHNTLVIAPNVYEYYKEQLKGLNIKLIKGEKILGGKYPHNIAYNIGRVYGSAIHNFKYTDELAKFYLEKENLKFIDVKQGYTKCSMAVVDETSIITADYPIYTSLRDFGYDPLLISPGDIQLEGQNYGFIGGATGNFSKDTIFLSGSLEGHPDKEKVENYIFKKNKKIIYLSNKKIVDIGTIITLNNNC